MNNWYSKITADISEIANCIDYFDNELKDARQELVIKNQQIQSIGAKLPGLVEYRFNQLQEVEAILEYLNIEHKKVKVKTFRKFLEHYNKSLSSRDAEKYTEGEPEVVNSMLLVNEFALLRNRYLGVIKGLEQISWMIGHVTRLKVAGLDDAIVD